MLKLPQQKKIIFPILFLVLILLATGLFLYFRHSITRAVSQPSVAKLSLENQKLNVDFQIPAKDQTKANYFFSKLGFPTPLTHLSFGLDSSSSDQLAKVLPTNLILDFGKDESSKTLNFSNQTLNLSLKSAVQDHQTEIATGSGSLKFSQNEEGSFYLLAQNPIDLVSYATSSGKLSFSTKLNSLLPNIKNIATIELRVDGKSIKGKIEVK